MLFDIGNIYNIYVIEERVEDSRREINTVIEQRRNAGSKGIRELSWFSRDNKTWCEWSSILHVIGNERTEN